MTKIKESSTVQLNKKIALEMCPVTFTMEKIGGYWKPIIIYHLSIKARRYSELKRAISGISEKVLIQNLKQLENDGLILRKAKSVVPPYVTYSLNKSGKKLLPIIHAMADWAFENMKEK